MERLSDIAADIVNDLYESADWYGDRSLIEDAINRLAAYEETGLEPKEIAKIREDVENGYLKSTARRYGITVDRFRELAEADREGRCVVLNTSRKRREEAFNVVVRYGFCGDCRHILDSDRCQKCDCFWNGVRIIRNTLLGDDADTALRREQDG